MDFEISDFSASLEGEPVAKKVMINDAIESVVDDQNDYAILSNPSYFEFPDLPVTVEIENSIQQECSTDKVSETIDESVEDRLRRINNIKQCQVKLTKIADVLKPKLQAPRFNIPCDRCGRILLDSKELRHHKWRICNREQMNKSVDQPNGIKQSSKKLNECNNCNKIFSSIYALNRHIENQICTTQVIKPVHKCDICNKVFRWFRNLSEHVKTHPVVFSCNKCDKIFESVYYLNKHKDRECFRKTTNSHKCMICHKILTKNMCLKTHMLIHSNEKPHSCSICGEKFRADATLREHMRSHSNEKPFQCIKCKNNFKYKSNLRRHEREVHLFKSKSSDSIKIQEKENITEELNEINKQTCITSFLTGKSENQNNVKSKISGDTLNYNSENCKNNMLNLSKKPVQNLMCDNDSSYKRHDDDLRFNNIAKKLHLPTISKQVLCLKIRKLEDDIKIILAAGYKVEKISYAQIQQFLQDKSSDFDDLTLAQLIFTKKNSNSEEIIKNVSSKANCRKIVKKPKFRIENFVLSKKQNVGVYMDNEVINDNVGKYIQSQSLNKYGKENVLLCNKKEKHNIRKKNLNKPFAIISSLKTKENSYSNNKSLLNGKESNSKEIVECTLDIDNNIVEDQQILAQRKNLDNNLYNKNKEAMGSEFVIDSNVNDRLQIQKENLTLSSLEPEFIGRKRKLDAVLASESICKETVQGDLNYGLSDKIIADFNKNNESFMEIKHKSKKLKLDNTMTINNEIVAPSKNSRTVDRENFNLVISNNLNVSDNAEISSNLIVMREALSIEIENNFASDLPQLSNVISTNNKTPKDCISKNIEKHKSNTSNIFNADSSNNTQELTQDLHAHNLITKSPSSVSQFKNSESSSPKTSDINDNSINGFDANSLLESTSLNMIIKKVLGEILKNNISGNFSSINQSPKNIDTMLVHSSIENKLNEMNINAIIGKAVIDVVENKSKNCLLQEENSNARLKDVQTHNSVTNMDNKEKGETDLDFCKKKKNLNKLVKSNRGSNCSLLVNQTTEQNKTGNTSNIKIIQSSPVYSANTIDERKVDKNVSEINSEREVNINIENNIKSSTINLEKNIDEGLVNVVSNDDNIIQNSTMISENMIDKRIGDKSTSIIHSEKEECNDIAYSSAINSESITDKTMTDESIFLENSDKEEYNSIENKLNHLNNTISSQNDEVDQISTADLGESVTYCLETNLDKNISIDFSDCLSSKAFQVQEIGEALSEEHNILEILSELCNGEINAEKIEESGNKNENIKKTVDDNELNKNSVDHLSAEKTSGLKKMYETKSGDELKQSDSPNLYGENSNCLTSFSKVKEDSYYADGLCSEKQKFKRIKINDKWFEDIKANNILNKIETKLDQKCSADLSEASRNFSRSPRKPEINVFKRRMVKTYKVPQTRIKNISIKNFFSKFKQSNITSQEDPNIPEDNNLH